MPQNPYTRKQHTDGKAASFDYYDDLRQITDQPTIQRINKLAIPPAWSHVEIARGANAKVQARGYDSAGRLQAIYHPTFRIKQDKLKFDRILRFADALPKLRRQLQRDLARKRLGKEKVLACIVSIIDQQYLRIGSDRYAEQHQTYGVTTLRSKHADIHASYVTFDFTGKSGQQHVKTIKDRQLARIIKQLDELPGYQIFRYQDTGGTMHDLHSHDVNAYIKLYMGDEFTAKDFRTWGGTLLATTAVLEAELPDKPTKTTHAKATSDIVKRVAKRLGNTPAIARSAYIDPRVFVAFQDGVTLAKLRKTMAGMRPRKYLSVDEQCVLKLLHA